MKSLWRWGQVQDAPESVAALAEHDSMRSARLIALSAVIVSVLTFGLAIARFALNGPSCDVAMVLLLTAVGFALTAVVARFRPDHHLGRLLLPVTGWLGTTSMAVAEGGLTSEALFWVPFIPVIGVLTSGLRGSFGIGFLALASPTALMVLHLQNLIPAHGLTSQALLLRWMGLMAAVLFAMILSVLYERSRIRTLARVSGEKRRFQTAHSQLQVLVDNLQAGVAITDERARLVVINQKLCEVFGLRVAPEHLVGQNTWKVIGEGAAVLVDPEGFRGRIVDVVAGRDLVTGDEVRFADGRVYERDFVPISLGENLCGHLWTYHDVTGRTHQEATVLSQLQTDQLTGVASRAYFIELLHRECEQAESFGVLYLDLDGFKRVNDTMGHDGGDAVLREVGDRLRGCVRSNDVVGRLGGDEFALILRGVRNAQHAVTTAAKIHDTMAVPFAVKGEVVIVGASVGVALYPQSANNPDDLLKAADVAMYQAKRRGRGSYALAPRRLTTGERATVQ